MNAFADENDFSVPCLLNYDGPDNVIQREMETIVHVSNERFEAYICTYGDNDKRFCYPSFFYHSAMMKSVEMCDLLKDVYLTQQEFEEYRLQRCFFVFPPFMVDLVRETADILAEGMNCYVDSLRFLVFPNLKIIHAICFHPVDERQFFIKRIL